MKNDKGEDIDVAPHAQMNVYINCDEAVTEGAMLRKKRIEN